nr:hypothetical protein 2 [Balneolaceae bacterium]
MEPIITMIVIFALLALVYLARHYDPYNGRSNSNVDGAKMAGDFKMWIIRGGKGAPELLVDKHNTIEPSLKEKMADALDGETFSFGLLPSAELFTDDNQRYGGTEDGSDGIVILRDQADGGNLDAAYTMTTTYITANQTYGKRFKGVITFSESITVDAAVLGAGFRGESLPPPGADGHFALNFATNTFTPEQVQQSDKIIIEWELYPVEVTPT